MRVSHFVGYQKVTFEPRPGTQDADVIREVWDDVTYEWEPATVIGRKVLDLGANIGAFTLWAAASGAEWVRAIEPEPNNYAQLLWHHRLNPRVGHWESFPVAASPFPVRVISAPGGASSQVERVESGGVEAWTLEACCDGLGEDIFVKSDIEGAEYALFAAAEDATIARIAQLVMEYHPAHDPTGPRLGPLVGRLAEHGRIRAVGRPSVGGLLFYQRY